MPKIETPFPRIFDRSWNHEPDMECSPQGEDVYVTPNNRVCEIMADNIKIATRHFTNVWSPLVMSRTEKMRHQGVPSRGRGSDKYK